MDRNIKVDSDPHLFNMAFDDKSVRNELLNGKEVNSSQNTGRVKRYRPGMAPEWVQKKEKEERERQETSKQTDKNIKVVDKRDSRLDRIEAAQNQRRRPVPRKHVEAELIIDEEEEDDSMNQKPLEKITISTKSKDQQTVSKPQEDISRRSRIVACALEEEEEEELGLEEEEEEFDIPKKAMPNKEMSEESEYEYEYDDSEDEGTAFALRHRPVFIPKTDRKTILDPEVEELKAFERQQKEEEKKTKRVEQTQRMIVEEKLREIEEDEAANQKRDARTLEVMPDDTDDLEDEEEIQAWKQREFDRIMRFRLKEEQQLLEEAEKLRREKMTDEELVKENEKLEKEGIRKKKQEHVQGAFLQKYYHKGVFYLDEDSVKTEDDIRNRDFHAPTEKDLVDKRTLPKIMQVREFGKRSQSKWTYLRNEDTTKNKDWLYEAQTKSAETKFKHAGNK